jgi:hypothetical protein
MSLQVEWEQEKKGMTTIQIIVMRLHGSISIYYKDILFGTRWQSPMLKLNFQLAPKEWK